jgi:outer membrane biosynthesis protein TonB
MHRVAAYTHNAVNSGSDLLEPPPASDMINIPVAWQEPTGSGVVRLPHLMGCGIFAARRYGDDGSDCDAHGTVLASLIGAVPSGEVAPDPPQIPAPPPPTAQMRTPPRPIAAPPPPKQSPPPPKQSPPPAKQAEPPAVAPQPGGAAGSGGSGNTGGGGPAEPSPTPPMPPGLVRLAP